ncbi:MAG: patatin family protein [Lachnospiraceae bacterium]|nr:patatin family protein [Lachnospiraceae bacterium]
MNGKVGIILEGGAMRSIFTAGILDYFLDKQIDIPNVLAVSAGAYAGMNYVSGQKGRIMDSVVEPLRNEQLLGLKVWLKTGDFFNMDLLFNRIPREESPFDFEAFQNSGKRFLTSVINCNTGEATYYDKFKDLDEFLHIIRVGNSLPLLAKVGYIDGEPMMDGGMADAIPVRKALEEGWDKIIVVFTREATYRKAAKGDIYNSKWVKLFYHKYKGLLKAIDVRPGLYNESIELLNKLEKEGRAFVFRPEGIKLTNKESNPDVLREYYKVGYEYADRRYEEFMAFLNA